MTSDFTQQALALVTTCRALFKQVSNEKAQLKCAKLIRNILQKNEIGKVFMGSGLIQYTLYFDKQHSFFRLTNSYQICSLCRS